MTRFQITVTISGYGDRQHIVKAVTQEMAFERITKSYPGRAVTIKKMRALHDYEFPA